ncbi:putative palmitoyltransferase, partial [Plasmodium gaboni]
MINILPYVVFFLKISLLFTCIHLKNIFPFVFSSFSFFLFVYLCSFLLYIIVSYRNPGYVTTCPTNYIEKDNAIQSKNMIKEKKYNDTKDYHNNNNKLTYDTYNELSYFSTNDSGTSCSFFSSTTSECSTDELLSLTILHHKKKNTIITEKCMRKKKIYNQDSYIDQDYIMRTDKQKEKPNKVKRKYKYYKYYKYKRNDQLYNSCNFFFLNEKDIKCSLNEDKDIDTQNVDRNIKDMNDIEDIKNIKKLNMFKINITKNNIFLFYKKKVSYYKPLCLRNINNILNYSNIKLNKINKHDIIFYKNIKTKENNKNNHIFYLYRNKLYQYNIPLPYCEICQVYQ